VRAREGEEKGGSKREKKTNAQRESKSECEGENEQARSQIHRARKRASGRDCAQKV